MGWVELTNCADVAAYWAITGLFLAAVFMLAGVLIGIRIERRRHPNKRARR